MGSASLLMTVETDCKVGLLIPVDLGRIPVEERHCNNLVAVDRTWLEENRQLHDETCELIVWPCITCRS
jgi:maleate cis-trans isomerase